MPGDPRGQGKAESWRETASERIGAAASAAREYVSAVARRSWRRVRPVVREQLTEWPIELDRRVDLVGESPTEFGDISADGEVLLYVHGFLGQGRLEFARISGAHQAAALESALVDAYAYRNETPPQVVAGVWHSSTTWPRAKRNADSAGKRLASWLQGRPDSSVTVVAHSLGARVTLVALSEIATSEAYSGASISSVGLLGAAVDPDSVCHPSGEHSLTGVRSRGRQSSGSSGRQYREYHEAIRSLDAPVYNYHSKKDHVVCRLYRLGELSAGLGCRGSDCRGGWRRPAGSVPDNFTDVDVSGQVTGHLDYYKPIQHTDTGNCIDQLLTNQLIEA